MAQNAWRPIGFCAAVFLALAADIGLGKAGASQEVSDYKFLENASRVSFGKDFTAAVAEGWKPVGVSHGGKLMLLAKSTGKRPDTDVASASASAPAAATTTAPSVRDRRQLSLDRITTSTLQKELTDAASQGYHVASSSAFLLTLEKPIEPAGRYDYSVVTAHGTSNVEKALNDAAAKGFRVLPGVILTKPGMLGYDVIVVMEKPPADISSAFTYRAIGAMREATFDKEMKQAIDEGWTSVSIVASGERFAILEKRAK